MDQDTKDKIKLIYDQAKDRKLDDIGATKEVFAKTKDMDLDAKDILRYIVSLKMERFGTFKAQKTRDPYSEKDKRYGCQINDYGYAIDYFTQEEIPEDLLISYKDKNNIRFCFNIESLYQYYKLKGEKSDTKNPINNQPLPENIIDELDKYGDENAVHVNVNGIALKMEFYNNIGELIIEVIRVIGNDILNNITNYDIFAENYSLYVFDLEDPINVTFRNYISVDYEEFPKDKLEDKLGDKLGDKENKLIKMFDFAKKRKNDEALYNTIYSHLGMFLAAVPYISVDGGIDYKVEQYDTVSDVLFGIYNALGGLKENWNKWDIVFEDGRPLYSFGMDKKVIEIAPGQEIYWVQFNEEQDIDNLRETLIKYAFINNSPQILDDIYSGERITFQEAVKNEDMVSLEEIISTQNYTIDEFIDGINEIIRSENDEIAYILEEIYEYRGILGNFVDLEQYNIKKYYYVSLKIFTNAVKNGDVDVLANIWEIIGSTELDRKISNYIGKNQDLYGLKNENIDIYNYVISIVFFQDEVLEDTAKRILDGEELKYDWNIEKVIYSLDDAEFFKRFLPQMNQENILLIVHELKKFEGNNIMDYILDNLGDLPINNVGVATILNYLDDKTKLLNFLDTLGADDFNKVLLSDILVNISPEFFEKLLVDSRVRQELIESLVFNLRKIPAKLKTIIALKSKNYNPEMDNLITGRQNLELFQKIIPKMSKDDIKRVMRTLVRNNREILVNWFMGTEYSKNFTEIELAKIFMERSVLFEDFLKKYSVGEFNKIIDELINEFDRFTLLPVISDSRLSDKLSEILFNKYKEFILSPTALSKIKKYDNLLLNILGEGKPEFSLRELFEYGNVELIQEATDALPLDKLVRLLDNTNDSNMGKIKIPEEFLENVLQEAVETENYNLVNKLVKSGQFSTGIIDKSFRGDFDTLDTIANYISDEMFFKVANDPKNIYIQARALIDSNKIKTIGNLSVIKRLYKRVPTFPFEFILRFEAVHDNFHHNVDAYLYFDPHMITKGTEGILEAINSFPLQTLEKCCRDGRINVTNYILNKHKNLEISDVCFIFAVKYNHVDMLKLLFRYKNKHISTELLLYLKSTAHKYGYKNITEFLNNHV